MDLFISEEEHTELRKECSLYCVYLVKSYSVSETETPLGSIGHC